MRVTYILLCPAVIVSDESDLNFVQGSFKEHFRRKKKTQKHNAKIGLSFERFQK